MNARILVAYATRYGSTQEVAETIASTLREHELEVDLRPMRDVRTLNGYDAIVLGAALYMFHWPKDAIRFLAQHREALKQRPVAIFALGPVHDPYDEQEWQDSRAQLDKELAKFPWLTPIAIQMFGGTFDPAKLRFPISWLASKAPASDARDWTAIRAWTNDLAAKLEPAIHEEAQL